MTGPGRLRRQVSGQAGAAPAWALAAVALLAGLIATAGPAEVSATQNAALRQELSTLSPLTSAVAVTAQWQVYGGQPGTLMTTGKLGVMGRSVTRAMTAGLRSVAGAGWATAATPSTAIVSPPSSATVGGNPPDVAITYASGLAGHSRVIAGTMPARVTAQPPAAARRASLACLAHHPGGQIRALAVQVAVTAATARRLGLRPGSRLRECPYQAGDPAITLVVTGVLAPLGRSGAYWTYNPALAAPQVAGAFSTSEHLEIAALIGPGELTALQAAWSGSVFDGSWFYPLAVRGLTVGGLPPLLAGIAALTASPPQPTAVPSFQAAPVVTCPFPGVVGTFSSQLQVVSALDALEVAGLFMAAAVLLLMCAGLAAEVHSAELAMVRARGAATAAVAAQLAARTWPAMLPALAAGVALASTVAPVVGVSWLLVGVTAGMVLAGPPVAAAWRQRHATRPMAGADRNDSPQRAARSRVRRLRRAVGELAVLGIAAGSLAELRYSGAAAGVNLFLDASPVLVAAAALVVVARVLPAVVAVAAPLAAGRRGPVAFLGVAGAARSRLGAALPALAMVLTLTLAAFGATITASITAGQTAASWRQAGADVLVQAPGNAVVTSAAARAVSKVAGVTHVTRVYVSGVNPPIAPTLVTGRLAASGRPVNLVIVDPASYAALAAATPWPSFPAQLLARPAGGGSEPVPMLASAGVAAAARRGPVALMLDGVRLPVKVVGQVGATPAAPAGGPLVVLPDWAGPRFPSIPGPGSLLATGTGAAAALRAALTRWLPGAHLTLRPQIFRQLAGSAAQRSGSSIYVLGVWAAGLLAAVATVFALATTAARRRLLLTRLTVLGMTGRQARAVALLDTLPLLGLTVLAVAAASAVLALAAGPAINLGVFTASLAPAPVRPTAAAILIPAAGVVVFAMGFIALERLASRRPEIAVTLRREEAG